MKNNINKLQTYRSRIDRTDQKLILLLVRRIKIVKRVAQYKRKNHLPGLDPKRWQEVLETRKDWGEKAGLSTQFISKIYNLLHQEALRIENEIL